ncbi:MAG: hypothetical protein IKD15_03810 [Clostridia bacterium]|nr:hypothetical protein [Clostridia bacterium]
MRVDKVILKAFLSTLAAIVLLFAFMFGVLVAAFPSTMMYLSYDFGRDESSIRYAERAYKWFEDTSYMAHAMEVAIGIDDSEKIEQCGLIVVEDEAYFAQYCAEKDVILSEKVPMSYAQYVHGKIAVAKYQQSKKEDAVQYAFNSLQGGFPQSNAVVSLMYTAHNAKDQATKDLIRGKMEQQNTDGLDETAKAYFDQTCALLASN